MELRRPDHGKAEFERFVAAHAAGLLSTAYLIVWDLGEAEDLVQETLFKLARRWPRVRAMQHPVAYARRVLVNLALDGTGRRSRRRQELGGELPIDRADAASARELESIDAGDELLAALAQLPPRQRAVLVLRYFLDLPLAEVAKALGCSLGTAKSSASRGLTRLEQMMIENSRRTTT